METVSEKTPLFSSQNNVNVTSYDTEIVKEPVSQNIPLKNVEPEKSEKLGIVMGVIIPVILSIWGVILFLRLGVLVGQGGVWVTLGLFVYSYTLTTLTIISVSAITTNGRVKGGGVYYLISRSLGPELGGSIGVIYFCGQIVSGGLFIVGYTDTLVQAFPSHWPKWLSNTWMKFLWGVLMLTLLALICLIGASLFAKTSLLIFAVLFFSIIFAAISMIFRKPGTVNGFTALSLQTFVENFEMKFQIDYDNPTHVFNIQYAFGILFPACTGIMTGANMSGDLENPETDIGRGTLFANAFTFVTYIGLAFLMAATISKQTLASNSLIMIQVSFVPWVITIGIFAAAISSALGNIIGASRILQALAKDELVPFIGFFKHGSGSNDEPRRAVIFCYLLIILIVFIGDINSIAPIITVLQTLTYGFVNFSCFFLSITGAPNFRPTFKLFSWWTALAGGVLCLFSMFFVSPIYAAIAFMVQALLIIVVHFYAPTNVWGDVSQALIYHQVRKYLLRLDNKEHVKTWRLQLLHLISNARSSLNLISFSNSLKKGGLYIVGNVIVGDFRKSVETISKDYEIYHNFFKEMNIKAFPDIAIAPNVREGCQNLLTSTGLGGMKPNTVILGWYDESQHPQQNALTGFKTKKKEAILKIVENFSQIRDKESPPHLDKFEYFQILKDCIIWKKSLLIARHFENFNKDLLFPDNFLDKILKKKNKTIDLWIYNLEDWKNNDATISLIIQLGYMISLVSTFNSHHRIRVLSIVENKNQLLSEQNRIIKLLLEWRIEAIPLIYSLSEKDRGKVYRDERELDSNGIIFTKEIKDLTSTKDKFKSINRIMTTASVDTSVIFAPLPPIHLFEETKENSDEYLSDLDVLYDNLPPTIMVYGNDKVINEEF